MTSSPLARLRRLCLALPESHEVMAWGAETFRVKNKLFAMYSSADSGHSGGRAGVWIKATAENQRLMVATWPTRFFVPPYVGPSGWVGVVLDERPEQELGDEHGIGQPVAAPARDHEQIVDVEGRHGGFGPHRQLLCRPDDRVLGDVAQVIAGAGKHLGRPGEVEQVHAGEAIEPGITECDLVRLKGKPATDVLVGESGKGQREVQVLYSEPGGRELYFFVNNRLDRVVKP